VVYISAFAVDDSIDQRVDGKAGQVGKGYDSLLWFIEI
jgi:hypothetical protein